MVACKGGRGAESDEGSCAAGDERGEDGEDE